MLEKRTIQSFLPQATFAITLAVLITCSSTDQLAAGASDLQLEGFQYVKVRNFPKALECFNAALKEHPRSWIIMQSVGCCHMELGQYNKAIEYFQRSIKIGDLHASQCKNIAAVFQRKGDAKKALNWLKLACKLDPALAATPEIQASISRLQDPDNNPGGNPHAPDYFSSLRLAKGWSKEAMPLKVHVRQNIQLPGYYPTFTASVRKALDQWRAATGNAIAYKFVDAADSADLVCDYTDHQELVSSHHELGIDGNTEMLVKQDSSPGKANIVVLVKDGPGAPNFKSEELVTLYCLHEVGHALGMHGHSPNTHDVMFPAVMLNSHPRLTERDKNTIRRIYQVARK